MFPALRFRRSPRCRRAPHLWIAETSGALCRIIPFFASIRENPAIPMIFFQQIHDAFIRDGKRVYRLLPAPLRRRFWTTLSIQFFSALTETCTLLVISLFAVSIAAPEAALNRPVTRVFLALIPPLRDWCDTPRHLVIFTSALMAGFIAFKVLLAALMERQSSHFSENVSIHVGRETLRRYLNKDYFWHLSPQSQSVLSKFSQRAQLSQFLLVLLRLYSNVLCSLLLFASLFLAEPRLTLLLITVFGLAGFGSYIGLRRRLDRAGQTDRDLAIKESAENLALTRGLREILINQRQNVLFSKMAATIAQRGPHKRALSFYNQTPSMVLELVGFGLISAVTMGMLFWGTPLPEIVSTISLLMLTAWRVLPSVNRALSQAISLRSLRPTAQTCLELLETFIAETPESLPAPDPDFRFRQVIALENVEFSYPSGQRILSGLNLQIRKGESIGLIGASGAGKSTLALLLTGLVSPQNGRFLVDGRELTPARQSAYARLTGFVPQSPLLMPGTVADNVAFRHWGEDYDRERVRKACEEAALDFILRNPKGIDYPIAANGQGLSGGQIQRVAIARALFASPEILIFDEATSALDQANENIINEMIARLPNQTTVIIIAHRLTTVEHCHRLLWLENGQVREEGPPGALLPRYRAEMAKQHAQRLRAEPRDAA
ncbi:MAG: ABC transporter ATP-binding protein/permease [Zoogloeaceae bacterium]|jgi:ABC-type multidrug transport system fused ATPase/permease subunit|nr:ABC transporter ATP-binding protein/permease [Zoogloeaceae bacterium]